MIHQFLRVMFVAGLTGLVALAFWPYHDGALRYGLLLSLLAVWSTGVVFVWRMWLGRAVMLLLPFLAVLPFCLPAKPIEPAQLRDCYVAAMRSMKGTPYLWGGESHRGIDCSGLPRLALREALWESGWKQANGAAFREWMRQWWFDTSAKALGENYREFTRPTGVSGKLRDLDFSQLVRGDLAITADGRHVMIYLGNGEWIQADPGPFKVSIGKPASDPNPWFDTMVNIQRWTMLE